MNASDRLVGLFLASACALVAGCASGPVVDRGDRTLTSTVSVAVPASCLKEAPPAQQERTAVSVATATTDQLAAAAAAVAWLATRALIYVDLRGPNVVVAGGQAWLVDFDDCIALDAPVRDARAFRAALVESGAAAAGGWASALVRGALPAVLAALAAAFDSAAAAL